jgi:hypothetical protein
MKEGRGDENGRQKKKKSENENEQRRIAEEDSY